MAQLWEGEGKGAGDREKGKGEIRGILANIYLTLAQKRLEISSL